MIQAIIDTLNKIEVHGKDNLDRLLGCIQALEEIKNAVTEKEDSENG